MSTKEVIGEGGKKMIGNGRGIEIWNDRWISNNNNEKKNTQKLEGCRLQKVSNLMVKHRWNRVLIFKSFSKDDVEHILNIPICLANREDYMVQTHCRNEHTTEMDNARLHLVTNFYSKT